MRFLPFFLFFLLSLPASSQPPFQLRGRVFNDQGVPLAGATCALLDASAAPLAAAISDSAGSFFLPPASFGAKILITLTGFKPNTYHVLLPNDTAVLQFLLEPEPTSLETIIVRSRPMPVQQLEDRTILQVGNSPTLQGTNALQLLQQTPGVDVDLTNNSITLRGRERVAIYINDKPTYLSPAELLLLLQQTSSSAVERVEVLQSPSSKYEASGNGIVNIVLKKSIVAGWTGLVNSHLQYGQSLKMQTSLSFSFNNPRWHFSMNAEGGHQPTHMFARYRRHIVGANQDLLIDVHNHRLFHNQHLPLSFQVEWQASSRQSWGLAVAGGSTRQDLTASSTTFFYSNRTQPDSLLQVATERMNRLKRYSSSFFHTLTSLNGRFQVYTSLDGAHFYRNYRNQIQSVFEKEGLPYKNIDYASDNPSAITTFSLKTDLGWRLLSQWILEGGGKYTRIQSDNPNRFAASPADRALFGDEMNARIHYTEEVHAIYVNTKGQVGKSLALQGGLRLEANKVQIQKEGKDVSSPKMALQVFPQFTLSQHLGLIRWQVSYSKRINRPNYNDLNPAPIINSPFLFYTGNPYLRPSLTEQAFFEITKKQGTLNLGWSRTRNEVIFITQQDNATRVQQSTLTNIPLFINVNLTATKAFTIMPFWKTQHTLNAFYNDYRIAHEGRETRTSGFSLNWKTSQQWQLPKQWNIEVTSLYQSPRTQGIIHFLSTFQLNLAIQKKLPANRGTLTIGVEDLFYSNTIRNVVRYNNLYIQNNARRETQLFKIGYLVPFGKGGVQRPKKEAASELQRLQ